MISHRIPPRVWPAIAAALIAIAGDAGAVDLLDPAATPARDNTEQVTRAAELVHQLQIAPETSHDTYNRDLFGSGWLGHPKTRLEAHGRPNRARPPRSRAQPLHTQMKEEPDDHHHITGL